MSRHRNVRSMNYEDEYYDEDDMYGHSVEDNYCISPGTAAQFTFNRDKDFSLSSYMGHEEGIPEEGEEDSDGDSLHTSSDFPKPRLSEMDEAKLHSCLEEIHNILGDTTPDSVLAEVVVKHNFSLEKSLEELLSQKEAPKPQRQPRQNRRNRSQAQQQAQAELPPKVTGPTVFLKDPPGKQNKSSKDAIDSSTNALSQVKVSDKTASPVRTGKKNDFTSSPSRGGKKSETVSSTPVKGGKQNGRTSANNKKSDSIFPSNSESGVQSNGAKIFSIGVNEDISDVTGGETLAVDTGQVVEQVVQSTPKKEQAFTPPLPRSASKAKLEKLDLKAEYEKRQGGKDMINMVVIGHVDAGKSTLMGHLLYQLGSVNKRAMHKYEQESKKLGKGSFAFAWVLDETEEERTRGVTMDIAQTRFETPGKIITLLDAPGHKDFIPNMITGTAQADVGILVVNATKGEFETGFESGGQTREHALLARSLGVSQMIIAVNKMDTVGWSQSRYDEIVKKLGQFLKQAGFKETDISFIPCSGLSGENLTQTIKEAKLSEWYRGPTLMEQIDKFKAVTRPVDKPLRICISDVFKGMGSGFSVMGKVASGSVQLGDRLLVLPAAEMAVVKGIAINDEAKSFAFAGDHVVVTITGIDIINVGIGSVLCDPSDPMKCASRIRARVVLFNLEIPITRGFTVIFHYQSITEPAIVKRLVSQLNKSSGEIIKNKPKCLTKNSSAVIEIEFDRPVCLEVYKDNKDLGRFMLRYSGTTIAAGLVEEVLKDKTGDTQGASAY